MAQLISVRLSRGEGQPWGFRLQGGKDFGTQLVLQKVNVGSIADKAGLMAGDAVIRVNNEEVFNMRHKDAQDAILHGGNNFEISVSRGGSTWRPSVTPLTSPAPTPTGVQLLTKTSIQANARTPTPNIGSGHNTAAKPFGGQQQQQPIKNLTNKQYNTPVGIYSEETIAETLSAQAEVLAGGAIGVNFKKNEKQFNPEKSDVLRALQEAGHEPEPENKTYYVKASHATGCAARPRSTTPTFVTKFQDKFAYTPSASAYFQHPVSQQQQIPTSAEPPRSNQLTPEPSHRPSQPIPSNVIRPAIQTTTNVKTEMTPSSTFEQKTSATTISSALSSHVSNLTLNGSAGGAPVYAPPPVSVPVLPSSTGPRPFSYTAPAAPTAAQAPKSPIAYPPPVAPTWSAPESASVPAVAPGKFNIFKPSIGLGAPRKGGISGKPYNVQNVTQPKRGRGVLNQPVAPGGRVPLCGCCSMQVRGPFITALGRIWCPEHFICVNADCKRPLADIGFVEEKGDLYCEYCFEQYLAPTCHKCQRKVKGDCLNAIGKQFHPECFTCTYCGKLFGNTPFFLEEGEPYCDADWNELFTTKCFACGFPVEAGDRWVEALNNNYHSQCFNCTMCKKNLEGQSFYAKAGRPFCKNHAR